MTKTDIEALYPLLEDSGKPPELSPDVLERAQGCLLGQLAGDSLGSLVEFRSESSIRAEYPDGVHDLADGGAHDTVAGQPTDDSEMALMLARSIIRAGGFDPGEAAVAYAHWFGSPPFDYGGTTAQALRPALAALGRGEDPASVARAAQEAASRESQANGALMRVSPLGILAHALASTDAAELARRDAALTHPHQVCQDASAVFVVAIAHAVREGPGAKETYAFVREWVRTSDATGSEPTRPIHPAICECLELAASTPPADFHHQQGWVLIALRNAFWQLLHAPSPEAGIVDTVMRGGDTDTNAAIVGALLGAVYGMGALPLPWIDAILSCRPERGRPGVHRPRPKPLWPVDTLVLAQKLVEIGSATLG
ncbi:MAG: ADP-ribosylglycohydrolase family protein [Thermoleophilia bacterium]|nr:ADP-ribosylglycohydrolase family protein [Thermoleophilia bacterium]